MKELIDMILDSYHKLKMTKEYKSQFKKVYKLENRLLTRTLCDEQMSAYLKLEAQNNYLHVIELDQVVEFTIKCLTKLK